MSKLNEIAQQIVDIFKEKPKYFENVTWCSCTTKYNEQRLLFKDGWNYSVSNLVNTDLTYNIVKNALQLKPFYEWLGERISLCLNLQKGKTNEELKLMLLNQREFMNNNWAKEIY